MRDFFIYAETAFHHEGDMEFMLRLIDAAEEAGADGIKFQVLINFDELIASTHPAYAQLKGYVFTIDQWREIFSYASGKALGLVVMPLDSGSFALIEEFKSSVRYLELHSVSYYDEFIKQEIRKNGADLILSVGGRTRKEIDEAIQFFGKQLTVLMTGFQAFPSAIADIRLRKIIDLVKNFPDLKIGYADHSSFDDYWAIESNGVAYTLGASVFEKHLTIAEGTKRVDYESAIGVEKLKQIKTKLNDLFLIINAYHDPFEMTTAEMNYRNRQKMVVAIHDLKEGDVVRAKDIALKMTGRFDGFARVEDLIGMTIKQPVKKDTIIKSEDVAR
jgi:N,N'-diacetyllegionaminate synthase